MAQFSFKAPLSIALAACLWLPATAQAGFEWTPPPAPKQMPESSSLMTPRAPLGGGPAVAAAPVTPVQIDDMTSMPPAPDIQPYPQAGPALQTQGAVEARALAAPAPQDDGVTYAEAQGFGKDIPLALVLRQIVPPEFSYSFDKDVEPGVLVSWDGGRPWNVVLRDALRPLGLQSDITNKMVLIRKVGAPNLPTMPFAKHNAHPIPNEMPSIAVSDGPQILVPPPGAEIAPMPTPAMTATTALTPLPTDTPPTAQPAKTVAPAKTAQVGPRVKKSFDPYEIKFWKANKGQSLRDVLAQWSDGAGVSLYWNAASDYQLPVDVDLLGTYVDAVNQILSAYESAAPEGKFYPNLPQGPSVLVIESAGNGEARMANAAHRTN